jgi:hypothetical protein
MLTLRGEMKRLMALPASGCAPQTTTAVADAILLESAAPTNGAAVAVLQQCITGAVGTQGELDRARKRLLAFIKKGPGDDPSLYATLYTAGKVCELYQRQINTFFKSLHCTGHHTISIGDERERLVTASPAMTKSWRPSWGNQLPGGQFREAAETGHSSPKPSRQVRR